MGWSPKQFAARGVSPNAGLRHGFRSGLETSTARWLEEHGQPVLFETFKIPYVLPMSKHKYTPDFLLANGIIVETKGIFDSADRAKHLIIQQDYPELDIRFVFSSARTKIAPGSKTTLCDWADKNGFRYAVKLIPEAWLKEPGPRLHPLEVLGNVS